MYHAGKRLFYVCCLVFVLLGCGGFMFLPVSAAPTSELHIVELADNGTRIVNETTITRQWMESHLPVYGDGMTHYYHQGPVFAESKEDQWDPDETTNFKDMGAVKGTAVKDLCEQVGGMDPGDDVMVKADDGYHVEFPYANIYTPEPRQGAIAVCWFNGEESAIGERQGVGYPPDYYSGMRLVFFADNSTNIEGKHVFGNADMRAVMPAESVHLFDNLYPSTSGYTVKWVDEIRVYQGGYHGTADALPKSFAAKTNESYTPPEKSPFEGIYVIIALISTALIASRRNR
jgi:hypothetical protein